MSFHCYFNCLVSFARKKSNKADCGSGTALGVMLVIAVCSMLAVAAILGHVLSARHQAYTVATAAALSGASALQRMENNPCEFSTRTVTSSHAILKSCKSAKDEVTVSVTVPLNIPLAPSVEASARAALEDCDK